MATWAERFDAYRTQDLERNRQQEKTNALNQIFASSFEPDETGRPRLNEQNALRKLYAFDAPIAMQYENALAKRIYDNQMPSDVRSTQWLLKQPENVKELHFQNKRSPQYLDIGSGYVTPNQANPTRISPVATRQLKPAEQPTYIHEKNLAEETGKAQGVAQSNLASNLDDINKMRTEVTGLLESPGFDLIYGKSRYVDPRSYDIGGPAAGSEARRKQLEGASFGIAIQKMRGLGQLSDAEGKKVTAAYTRATDPHQGEEDAKKAWEEVIYYLNLAEQRAKEKAGREGTVGNAQVTGGNSAPKGNAPQSAINYLRSNDSPAMRKQFMDKYGYLP